MTESHPIGTGERLKMLEDALRDARTTLVKTAAGRIGSDELTIPRAAFDSVLRNIDRALSTLRKDEAE